MMVSSWIVWMGAFCGGYIIFLLLLRILPKRLHSENRSQKSEILKEAGRQADNTRRTSYENYTEHLQMLEEEFAADLKEAGEDLKIAEEEMESRESSIRSEESRLRKAEKDMETLQNKHQIVETAFENKISELDKAKSQLVVALESQSATDAELMKKELTLEFVEARRIEAQKRVKAIEEESQTLSGKLSNRLLSRALSRYAPEFSWPKNFNHVEIKDKRIIDNLQADDCHVLNQAKELAGIEVEIIEQDRDDQPTIIKLAGGGGIDREAARLSLTELLKKHANQWHNLDHTYSRHRQILEKQAMELGRVAIRELQLPEIHPEIAKLVGYLNWRTSYRQNQFLHSLEVAKLAGILAVELGVDVEQAKRCGLLHDIGKALDYRIEGSHAVISGDYADRYGESKLICDTVMSHHNDLIVETPLAYVLKTADTLSGARPGARVNLEEGYQVRLTAIEEVVKSFPGVTKTTIMNGGREVHVEVNYKKVKDRELEGLSAKIARKIEDDVAFPGQIKVLVTRRFEAVAVA